MSSKPFSKLLSNWAAKTTSGASKSTKKKPSLFGDEEEADLFGEGGGLKETATKKSGGKLEEKAASAKDSLFGEDDSAQDDLFGVLSTKPRADSARKKPVGGVALFGGADLFGKKDKQPEDGDSKNEPITKPVTEIKAEVSKPPPRKNTLSLFDDDEDELFGGGVQTDTPPKSAAAKSVGVTKGRSQSKSLFQDEDVLFGGPQEENPSVDLFGATPPVTPPVTPQKTASKASIPAPSNPASRGLKLHGATTASSSTDLFGSDDNEEDLFGQKPNAESKPEKRKGKINLDDATTTETSDEPEEKKNDPPKPHKPPGAVSVFGDVDPFSELKKKQKKNETPKPKDPLFGEDEEEGSLFAKPRDSKPADGEGEPKPVAAKPKKPAGAVSMFGGIDPLGGLKARAGSKGEEKKDQPTGEDILRKPTGPSSKEKVETSSGSASPPSPGKGIGKLKANLMINPAALLPGAAPTPKAVEPVPVGFDQPAEATTLHSETKDRARILTRRRPQSRKARKQAASSTEVNFSSEEIMTSSESSPSSHAADSPVTKKGAKTSPSSDLFGNDDILEETTKGSGKSDPILAIGMDKGFTDNSEDIFQKEFPRTQGKNLPTSIKEEEDDLFSVNDQSKTKASSTTKVTPTSSKSDNDDLFAGLKTNSSPGVSDGHSDPLVANENSTTSNIGNQMLHGDTSKTDKPKVVSLPDDDDLFADSKIIKKAEPKPAAESEDLFSDSILNKPAAVKTEKLDDDDIFSAPVVKKEKKKKQATKDEDLFKDDTDIFADLPATKPKEKKKKKSTASKKSVFKDDVDDIFAESGTLTKTKKDSEKRKKTASKKKEEVENIFDDPLNAAGP